MDVFGRFLTARNIEVATARRAGANEYGIPAFSEQCFQTVDALASAEFDSEVENVATLLIDDGIGQTEFWNLRADHSAGFVVLIEYYALVAERVEGMGGSERRRGAAGTGGSLGSVRRLCR